MKEAKQKDPKCKHKYKLVGFFKLTNGRSAKEGECIKCKARIIVE